MMSFNSLEIIALLFAVLSIIKLIFILVKKNVWFKYVVKPIYKNKTITIPVMFILCLIIFYYLIRQLSIVEIFSVISFTSLLIALGLISYSDDLIPLFEKIYKRKFNLWQWIYIIIWIALLIFLSYNLF